MVHVSVFASVTRGEFDNELDWPFQGYIKVEVDVGCYEETFKFTSRSPAKATGRGRNKDYMLSGQMS